MIQCPSILRIHERKITNAKAIIRAFIDINNKNLYTSLKLYFSVCSWDIFLSLNWLEFGDKRQRLLKCCSTSMCHTFYVKHLT